MKNIKQYIWIILGSFFKKTNSNKIKKFNRMLLNLFTIRYTSGS